MTLAPEGKLAVVSLMAPVWPLWPLPLQLSLVIPDGKLSLTATVAESPEFTSEALGFMAEGKITTEGMISEIADPPRRAGVRFGGGNGSPDNSSCTGRCSAELNRDHRACDRPPAATPIDRG